MLIKTHLAITTCLILLLIPAVEYKIIFVVIALLATYIPDIDTRNSKIGHHWYFRPLQWFSKHRGFVHSFTFLLLITLLLAMFFPIVSLGFFVGYGSHLLADSFTIEGIKPFYPSKKVSNWKIRTGGKRETTVFLFFLITNSILLVIRIFEFF